MDRVISQELQELYDSGTPVYSISRLDTINHCLYEAYRTYILRDKGGENVYASLGTFIHDALEEIVREGASTSILKDAVSTGLMDADVLGLYFPKDRNGGNSIRDGWIKNIRHFCDTYEKPDGKFKTEEFFLYKTPAGHYLQGYIDLQRINDDGSVDIYDYKTSTKYSGKETAEHGRQLVVYKLGLEQKGIKVRSVNWVFLKYANVTYNGKTKSVERRKIGQEYRKAVEDCMIKHGFDEFDIDIYVDDFVKSNNFESLPQEVAEEFEMSQCIVNYNVTDTEINECIKYVDSTIEMWYSIGKEEENYKPYEFLKKTPNGETKEDLFYCIYLCGHFKNCHFVQDYLEGKNDIL